MANRTVSNRLIHDEYWKLGKALEEFHAMVCEDHRLRVKTKEKLASLLAEKVGLDKVPYQTLVNVGNSAGIDLSDLLSSKVKKVARSSKIKRQLDVALGEVGRLTEVVNCLEKKVELLKVNLLALYDGQILPAPISSRLHNRLLKNFRSVDRLGEPDRTVVDSGVDEFDNSDSVLFKALDVPRDSKYVVNAT